MKGGGETIGKELLNENRSITRKSSTTSRKSSRSESPSASPSLSPNSIVPHASSKPRTPSIEKIMKIISSPISKTNPAELILNVCSLLTIVGKEMGDVKDGEVWKRKVEEGIIGLGEVEDPRVREGIEVVKQGLGNR